MKLVLVQQLAIMCRCMGVLIKQAAQQVNMRFMEKTAFNFQALQQPELPEPVLQCVASPASIPVIFSAYRHHDGSVSVLFKLLTARCVHTTCHDLSWFVTAVMLHVSNITRCFKATQRSCHPTCPRPSRLPLMTLPGAHSKYMCLFVCIQK